VKFGAVILAGGASRRMGSPKALLPFKGQTFLTRLTSTFEAECDKVVIVLGYNADAIRPSLKETTAQIVVNPSPERGQLTSLQAGLKAVQDTDYIFFTPVDYPAIDPATVRTLRTQNPGDGPVVPQRQGKHGHPVLIPVSVARELIALPESETARTVMHRHIPNTRYIEVDDPGILLDVDDPEAYRILLEAAQ
jgi:molybdenum cofactor cytidylyltransferase